MKKNIIIMALAAWSLCANAQADGSIRLNQVGYTPKQEKIVVIDQTAPKKMSVVDQNGKVVAKPKVLRTVTSPWSGKKRTVVQVPGLTTEGSYTFKCGKESMPLVVKAGALHELSKAALKMFYYMRTAVPIERQYAGEYARPAGHPDDHVLVHPAAASRLRPGGTVISSPKGWYDAGDYNKYVVNSSFSIGMMLASYEQNRDYFDRLKVNIPESNNATPDILDEMMFNLEWLLTMQDPSDGGVYHKLTDPNFDGFVMPSDCHQQRYVVAKTTTAALDFAAVMAMAARIMEGNADYPDFSVKAANAAVRAYAWAQSHPTAYYRQNQLNERFEPKVFTGAYDDEDARDEFFWAATELYMLTCNEQFRDEVSKYQPASFARPVWGQVSALGVYEWLSADDDQMRVWAMDIIKTYCDQLIAGVEKSNFQAPCGDRKSDFGWGCLAEEFCAPALTLLFADTYIEPGKYRHHAQQNIDYVLGRNALGYCYVTGFGQKSPMHPHHRLSEADGITAPVPGMLVGGPNPMQQDKGDQLVYTSNYPDESYIDHTASYASNEIAINWNASLLAVVAWLDAIMQ